MTPCRPTSASVSFWYDRFGRVTDTAVYGTNGGTTFARPSDPPVSPASELVTSHAYGDDGAMFETTDPRGIVTRTEHDAAGRVITTIRNYVNGSPSSATADDDQIIRFVYENGQRTKYWVDLYPASPSSPGTEDQVTVYTYGVTKGGSAGDSKISSGSLLQKVAYPDSTGGTDVVTFAYNAQGQEIWRKDQSGNVMEATYDDSGRRIHERATTIVTGFDDTVRRISTAYDDHGRVTTAV